MRIREITYYPVTVISHNDPVTCAAYSKKHGLLDTAGWKCLKCSQMLCQDFQKTHQSSQTLKIEAS